MNKKLFILTAALGALLAGSVLGVRAVSADETAGNRFPFVQELAERLGISEDEVAGAMEDVREEHRVEMQEWREERLSDAVEDGVITEEQKQALLDRQAEIQENRQQFREDCRQWMEESGIDFEALREYRDGCGGRCFGRGGFCHGFKGV